MNRIPTTYLHVLGEWPDNAIWLWYAQPAARGMKYDCFSVSHGIVRFTRHRGAAGTTINGEMSPDGGARWYSARLPSGWTVDDKKSLARIVARSAPAIDYLLDVHDQRLTQAADGSAQTYSAPGAPAP